MIQLWEFENWDEFVGVHCSFSLPWFRNRCRSDEDIAEEHEEFWEEQEGDEWWIVCGFGRAAEAE